MSETRGTKRGKSRNYRSWMYFLLGLLCLAALVSYYYFSVREAAEEEVYLSLRRDATYVGTKLEETVDQVIEEAKGPAYTTAMQKVLFSDDASEKILNIATPRELIASVRDGDEYIIDLFYHAATGHLYTASVYYDQFRSNRAIYGLDGNDRMEDGFISDVPIHDKKATYYFLYIPVRSTAVGIAHKTRSSGFCAILCNFAPLLKNCADIIGENDSCYFLYNDEIISTLRPVEGLPLADLLGFEEGDGKVKIGEELFFCHAIRDGRVRVISLAPQSVIGFERIAADKTFYVIIAVSVLVFAILLFVLNKNYTAKTERMVSELNSIRLGTGKMRVSVPNIYEIRSVAEEINSMLERLEKAAEREKETGEKLLNATVAQQEAEMTAYRSQINPHFFFNTLECVRSMAQYYNAEMIEEIVTAMSKMFRYSLYSDMVVELSAEIDMIRQYFVITSFRFPDKYVLKEELDEKTLGYRVPSMILQPLVENCIKHAFTSMPLGKKNEITVKSSLTDEGLLKIDITDNGNGMDEETLTKLRKVMLGEVDPDSRKDSIGVNNIYTRVKLFDKRNEMKLCSEVGEYTRVELLLYPAEI